MSLSTKKGVSSFQNLRLSPCVPSFLPRPALREVRPRKGFLSRGAQLGPRGWRGGRYPGPGGKYRERAPSPAAPLIPSHPGAPAGGSPGPAGRGAAGREGAARVTSAVPPLREVASARPLQPPPRVSLSPGRGERRALSGRPSWSAPRPAPSRPAPSPPGRAARSPAHRGRTGEGGRRPESRAGRRR